MIRKKTLFVVGAGASCKYGLPLGAKLVTDIADLLSRADFDGTSQNSRDRMFSEALRLLANVGHLEASPHVILRKLRRMADALVLAPSIDAYIESHKADSDIATIGKLAIAALLLEAEERSDLAKWKEGTNVRFGAEIRGSWLGRLFPILVEGVDAKEIPKIFENLSFIVFNYDRCIEHFLSVHLHGYFGIDLTQARTIVSKCTILHPYGSLGPLIHREAPIPFGPALHKAGSEGAARLIVVARNLRTYSEFQADTEEMRLAKKVGGRGPACGLSRLRVPCAEC